LRPFGVRIGQVPVTPQKLVELPVPLTPTERVPAHRPHSRISADCARPTGKPRGRISCARRGRVRGRTDAALVSAVLRDQLATNTRSARAPHRLLGLREAKAAFESELDPDADVREMRARADQLQMLENIKPLIDRTMTARCCTSAETASDLGS
jgi:hypothetical protein